VFVAVGLDTNLLMRHTTALAARFKGAAQAADNQGKVY
jgi:4-hydroxy-2-oxoheptanedioate aldolase